jgi:MATE family multidrug resistance protein
MANRRQLDHKIWGIAWPAILSNISVPLLGLVDAAILGHLGSTRYLGAVAIGGAVLSFLYWGFSFLRMGTTGLVAKATGAGRPEEAVLVLARSAILALVIAAAVIATHPLWLDIGFRLMAPQPELAPLADSYASIRIYSAPAVLVTYTIVGWFIGNQNTRWPMAIMVSTNALNIVLDFLLIVGLGLNSDGAAYATLLAEYAGCLLALAAVWHCLPRTPFAGMRARLFGAGGFRRLLTSNQHLFLRTVALLFSFAFFTAMGDKLGPDTLAANALMMQLLILTAYGLDGFAYAAEGLVGNALGARDLAAFEAAVARCTWWSAAAAMLTSVVFLLGHGPLYRLLTDIDAVRGIMDAHTAWLVALPLIAAPCYLLDGVFIGSAETRYMMTTMLFSTLCVYLPLWYVTQGWGNHGLWFAFTAFNASRGAALYYCFFRLNRTGAWLDRG